jgi:DNA-directed RNA polymerase subunit E'/Rpb7
MSSKNKKTIERNDNESKNNKNNDKDNSNKQYKNDDGDKKNIALVTSNLHNPSTNTTLVCPIMLYPNQMDNKMHIHIKSNLTNGLEKKCYKNYGYINKIFSIEETSDGIIEAEDPTCSAKIIVRFTCNLCLPIIEKEIICKIDRMNKVLISAINGPIKAIITADKINKEKFFPDVNRNIRIKLSSQVVIPDMYIRVLVLSRSFSDYDKNIIVIGYLQDIATQEEIDKYGSSISNETDVDTKFFEE